MAPKKSDSEDILKSDVASFASSLGLSSSLPYSGFNDSDFRKTGPLKQSDSSSKPKYKSNNKKDIDDKAQAQALRQKKKNPRNQFNVRPKPILSIDNNNNWKGFDRFKNLPKLPLVKSSALGVWYVDAAQLEDKVFGEKRRKAEINNVEEWKSVVEKKQDLGERLLAQYANDFETSKGQSGDIKMLTATQRSGTAADKVSAFSVMVAENPLANIKSLDALIGRYYLYIHTYIFATYIGTYIHIHICFAHIFPNNVIKCRNGDIQSWKASRIDRL